MPVYSVRRPTVGDLRAVYAAGADSGQTMFVLAERCMMIDGSPIGRERLDALETDVFEKLMTEMNAPRSVEPV